MMNGQAESWLLSVDPISQDIYWQPSVRKWAVFLPPGHGFATSSLLGTLLSFIKWNCTDFTLGCEEYLSFLILFSIIFMNLPLCLWLDKERQKWKINIQYESWKSDWNINFTLRLYFYVLIQFEINWKTFLLLFTQTLCVPSWEPWDSRPLCFMEPSEQLSGNGQLLYSCTVQQYAEVPSTWEKIITNNICANIRHRDKNKSEFHTY